MLSLIELKLNTAIKEAGDYLDVRLSKGDAIYILELLSKYRRIKEIINDKEHLKKRMDVK